MPASGGTRSTTRSTKSLRSPLDRIIESAERIVDRADGPLRSDYATYGNDIAAAARHLLSVIRSMSEEQARGQQHDRPGRARRRGGRSWSSLGRGTRGHDRSAKAPTSFRRRARSAAVIQILVNLIGNAIRHSPEGGTVRLTFARTARDGVGDCRRRGQRD